MTFFWNCWKWPSELRARTQRSHDLILDLMGNPTHYLRKRPPFQMDSNYEMFQSSFLTCTNSPFLKNKKITVKCGCNVNSADMMKSQWGISSCVTLLLQPGSWHETGSLSFSNPAREPNTSLVHLCVLFFQMRRLIGYLSSIIPVRAGFSRSHSSLLRSEVWMPVSEERRQNGLKWRGGYCWGGH